MLTGMLKIHLLKVLCAMAMTLGVVGCEDGDDDGDAPGFRSFLTVGFDGHAAGVYTRAQLDSDWANPPWSVGVREGRVAIVDGADAYAGRSLRVSYPRGTVGLGGGGASWPFLFGARDEVYCAYRFQFRPGFEFVRGGKLPGLAGGTANDGGSRPNGRDGWSVRLMWRENGRMSAYVYHPDQPSNFGEDFYWSRSASAGTWHRVVIRVRMNTPGRRDGIVQCWLDGRSVLSVETLRFRDTAALAIDQFFFSTFFGGGDASWAAARDEFIAFDDFQVGTP